MFSWGTSQSFWATGCWSEPPTVFLVEKPNPRFVTEIPCSRISLDCVWLNWTRTLCPLSCCVHRFSWRSRDQCLCVGVFRLLEPRAAQPLFLNWWNNKKIFFDWKKGQPVMPSLSLGKFAVQSIWSELGGNTNHDHEFLRRLQLDLRTKAKSYELRTEISSD